MRWIRKESQNDRKKSVAMAEYTFYSFSSPFHFRTYNKFWAVHNVTHKSILSAVEILLFLSFICAPTTMIPGWLNRHENSCWTFVSRLVHDGTYCRKQQQLRNFEWSIEIFCYGWAYYAKLALLTVLFLLIYLPAGIRYSTYTVHIHSHVRICNGKSIRGRHFVQWNFMYAHK